MKNLIIMIILVCLLCNGGCTAIGGTSGNTTELSTDAPEINEKLVQEIQGTIFVNDIQLESCSYLRIYTDDIYNIAIPVLAVVKALGAQVWESDAGIFQIQYVGVKYTLDMYNKTIKQDGKVRNLIDIPPGGRNTYIERRENDFYVDNVTLLFFLRTIGAEIRYSYSTGKVIISSER